MEKYTYLPDKKGEKVQRFNFPGTISSICYPGIDDTNGMVELRIEGSGLFVTIKFNENNNQFLTREFEIGKRVSIPCIHG